MKRRVCISGCIAVMIICTTILLGAFCCRMNKVDRLERMVEQYDTTTMMNKMVIMPRIIDLADSIGYGQRH